MATKEKTSSSLLDTLLLWLALAVLAASFVGYYWFSSVVDVVRVLGMIGGAAVAVLIVFQTQLGKTAWSYIRGSRVELRKVAWPNRRETVQTTIMVIVFVLLLAMFIALMDLFLGWGVQLIAHR